MGHGNHRHIYRLAVVGVKLYLEKKTSNLHDDSKVRIIRGLSDSGPHSKDLLKIC